MLHSVLKVVYAVTALTIAQQTIKRDITDVLVDMLLLDCGVVIQNFVRVGKDVHFLLLQNEATMFGPTLQERESCTTAHRVRKSQLPERARKLSLIR